MKQDLQKRVKDMKGVLGRHLPQARQALGKLLNGKLPCITVMVCESKEYQETGQGNYHGLLPSTLVPILLASPAGFKENGNWSCPGFVDRLVKPEEGQEAPSRIGI